MIPDLYNFLNINGNGRKLFFLLLLRCPFDIARTIILSQFLQVSFKALAQNNLTQLYFTCFVFLIANIALFLYNGTIWSIFSTFTIHWVYGIRKKIFQLLCRLSLKTIDDKSFGEWFSRLNSDVIQACAILNQPLHLPHAVAAFVNVILSSVLLLYLNLPIFVLVNLFLIPHILISHLFLLKPITKLSKNAKDALIKNTQDINSLTTCAETIILYDANEFLLQCFEKSSNELRRINITIRRRNTTGNTFLSMLSMCSYLFILFTCGCLIRSNQMTLSHLIAAFQYRISIITSSMILTNSLVSLKVAMISIKRFNQTVSLNLEEES